MHNIEQPNMLHESVSSNGMRGDSYQKMMFGGLLTENRGEHSSNINTPENEQIPETVIGLMHSQIAGSQKMQEDARKSAMADTLFINSRNLKHEESLPFENTFKHDKIGDLLEREDFNNDTFEPMSGPVIEIETDEAQINRTLHSIKSGFDQDVNTNDEYGPGSQKAKTKTEDQYRIMRQASIARNGKIENQNVPIGSAIERKLFQIANSQAVFGKGLLVNQKDIEQKRLSFINKQVQEKGLTVSQAHTSYQMMFSEPGQVDNRLMSDSRDPACNQSMLSSGFSNPPMISKLNFDGEPHTQDAQKNDIIEVKKDEDIVYELEQIQQRQYSLEVAQRDVELITMLKQQIEEDQMQIYELNRGLKSGMIKVDPQSLNKAIIQTFMTQNQRWQNQAKTTGLNFLQFKSLDKPSGEQPLKIVYKDADGRQLIELSSGQHQINGYESIKNCSPVHTRKISEQSLEPIGLLLPGKNNHGRIIVRMNRDQFAQQAIKMAFPKTVLNSKRNLISSSEAYPRYAHYDKAVSTVIDQQSNTPEKNSYTNTNQNSFTLLDLANQGTEKREQTPGFFSNRRGVQKPAHQAEMFNNQSQMLNEQVNDQSHDQKIITKWTLLEHTGEGTASTPPHNLDRRFFSTIGENQATNQDLNFKTCIDDVEYYQNETHEDRKTAEIKAQILKPESKQLPEQYISYLLKQPMKKFVNLYEQTKIPRIEPSILKQTEVEHQQIEKSGARSKKPPFMFQKGSSSACEARATSPVSISPIYNPVLASAVGGINALKDKSRLQIADLPRPMTASSKMNIQDSFGNRESLVNQESIEIIQFQLRNHRINEQYQIDNELNGFPMSGNVSHTQLLEPIALGIREKITMSKEFKGNVGQQTVFGEIDVAKLAADKSLNRHILGQQNSSQYEQIRHQAQIQAAGSKTTNLIPREREKAFISQKTANQRSMRNIKSILNRSEAQANCQSSRITIVSKSNYLKQKNINHSDAERVLRINRSMSQLRSSEQVSSPTSKGGGGIDLYGSNMNSVGSSINNMRQTTGMPRATIYHQYKINPAVLKTSLGTHRSGTMTHTLSLRKV